MAGISALLLLAGVSFAKETKLDSKYGEPAQFEKKKAKPIKLPNGKTKLDYGPLKLGKRQDAAMKKWRGNRFGQFIHWGLYSIPGGIWEGQTYGYEMVAVPTTLAWCSPFCSKSSIWRHRAPASEFTTD